VTLRIQLRVLTGIADHARTEAPRECCGLLVGHGDVIDEYIRTDNIKASEVEYEIDPAQHFAAIKRTRQMGRTILGGYHSHPRSPAAPSPTDLARAYTEFLYVIVSLREAVPDIRAYRLIDGRFASVPFTALP
jgi:[CysO sulfur-carrier protein]-S-L-cysteine hydrolase